MSKTSQVKNINGPLKENLKTESLKKGSKKDLPKRLLQKGKDAYVKLTSKAKDLAAKNPALTELGQSVAEHGVLDTLKTTASFFKPELEEEKGEEEVKAEEEKQEKIKELKEAKRISLKKKTGHISKPGIFFITGFESLSSSTDYGGLRDMADNVPGAKAYAWDEKDEILEEIMTRKKDQPIILVGHSFGGDTAMEIAEDLNTLENGFRKVDLLVTLDSVGSNNDIVPQNVKRNHNFFGEDSWWLNDEPNVARKVDLTEVVNELRPETHRELDNSKEIQYKIMEQIDKIL